MLEEVLSDVRSKLENNCYQNEEHIRLSLVSRFLYELGWDIWNPKDVDAEFKAVPDEDSTRVDLALFIDQYSPPAVFIEIKSIGKIELELNKIELQLRDYNRNNTAQFSIITDGQRWRFYYSQTGGEFSQKRFKVLDILQDDSMEVINAFELFLSKEQIENENAKNEAERLLQLNKKQRVIEEAFPKAKRIILDPPYPSLPDALVKLVLLQGFQLSFEEAKKFIKENEEKKPSVDDERKITVVPEPHQKSKLAYSSGNNYELSELLKLTLEKSKPSDLIIEDSIIKVRDWSDLVVKFVKWLIQAGYLFKNEVPIFNYAKRDKYFINNKAEHKDPNKDALWKELGIWNFYVDTKYNAKNIVKNLITTLEIIGKKDINVKIVLR